MADCIKTPAILSRVGSRLTESDLFEFEPSFLFWKVHLGCWEKRIRERERERECVCVREREREREIQRKRKKEGVQREKEISRKKGERERES